MEVAVFEIAGDRINPFDSSTIGTTKASASARWITAAKPNDDTRPSLTDEPRKSFVFRTTADSNARDGSGRPLDSRDLISEIKTLKIVHLDVLRHSRLAESGGLRISVLRPVGDVGWQKRRSLVRWENRRSSDANVLPGGVRGGLSGGFPLGRECGIGRPLRRESSSDEVEDLLLMRRNDRLCRPRRRRLTRDAHGFGNRDRVAADVRHSIG